MKRTAFIATIALAGTTVLTSLLATAQTPQEPPAPLTLRVDVQLVSVVATVTDAEGHHVPNLKLEDFTVLEDGVPQKISHFSQDYNVPVSVGILLDTSGSMLEKMKAATEAVERFINNVHPDDDIFLMSFAGQAKLEQDFTSDRNKLAQALNGIRITGGTVLYDALNEGLDKVQMGRHKKRAILVISDGMDAGSKKAKLPTLLDGIRGSEVLVYGLGTAPTLYADPVEHVPFTLPTARSAARGPRPINNPQPPTQGPPQRGGVPAQPANGVNMSVMRQFADNSGGQAYLLADTFIDSDSSDIDRVLTSIADELRGQYTLGFYPTSGGESGKLHSIRVTTRAGQRARTRTGYLGK